MPLRKQTKRDIVVRVSSHREPEGASPMSRYSLDSVTIDGFRGLRNLRLEDTGLINVLVGPNNCGKTSVLTLTPYSYQINSVQVSAHSRHVFGEDGAMVLELVRECEPDVRGVVIASFRGTRPAIYLDHRRLGPAPLSVFGDALRRAVLLASTLLTLRGGGILLIDEVETGIHISALQRVFAWLTKAARDFQVQVFATTDSLEAVDAILMARPHGLPDLVTYHLDQTEQETRVKRIGGELLHRLRRERALDVR